MAAFVSCICLRRVWAATASAAHLIVVHLCLAAARRLSKLRSLTWRGTPVAEDQNSWRRQLVSWAPRALMRLDGRRLSRSRQQHAERKIPQRPANEIVGHQPHATAAAQAEATSDQRRQNSTDGTERQRISTDGTEASLDVSSLHENDFEDTETDHDSSAMESTDVEPDATPKSDNGQTLGPTVTRVQCEQGRAGVAAVKNHRAGHRRLGSTWWQRHAFSCKNGADDRPDLRVTLALALPPKWVADLRCRRLANFPEGHAAPNTAGTHENLTFAGALGEGNAKVIQTASVRRQPHPNRHSQDSSKGDKTTDPPTATHNNSPPSSATTDEDADSFRALVLAGRRYPLFELPAALPPLPDPPWAERVELLDLQGLQLTALVDLTPFTNLRRINLNGNRLASIECLSGCPSLCRIDAECNDLRSVPSSFSSLSNLQRLEVRGNSIVAVPPTLTQLPVLQQLGLAENLIDDAALEALHGHGALVELSIRNNLLTDLR
eukprot:GHVT01014286.1.p1 GENE.GHVT01014286.1~~GHVT01014286.1.p1  ORF type:complete len:493 (-),score=74.47 GHVT01014286.1:2441-3919(-)